MPPVRLRHLFLPREQKLGCERIAGMMRRVIAGLDPAISMTVARPCQLNRDDRDKPGHDGKKGTGECKSHRGNGVVKHCRERISLSDFLSLSAVRLQA